MYLEKTSHERHGELRGIGGSGYTGSHCRSRESRVNQSLLHNTVALLEWITTMFQVFLAISKRLEKKILQYLASLPILQLKMGEVMSEREGIGWCT